MRRGQSAVQCSQAVRSMPCHQRRVAGATALEGQSQHQLGRCHGLRVAAGAARSPRCQKYGELTSSRFGATSTGLATGFPPTGGATRIATLARSGQQACAGTCALRHHSRHNSAPALPPPSDDVRWGQSTPASSLIAREARPLAAASDLRRRLDRRWPRWRPT